MKRFIVMLILCMLAATATMRFIASMNNNVLDQMVITKVASFVIDKRRMPNSWMEFNGSVWGKDLGLDDIKVLEKRLSLPWSLKIESILFKKHLVFRRNGDVIEPDIGLSEALKKKLVADKVSVP